jgi:competence protein ComEC
LPLFLFQPLVPEKNNFWVTILDVGQGLSVLVKTNQHTLLYDAGPRFGNQFDTGESVILPYLRHHGITAIDTMVISHGDNDHIGGAFAVMQDMPVHSILTSATHKFPAGNAKLCLDGLHWQWDGVNFQVIYPRAESLKLGNDSSCVLRVNNGKYSVLLTGDIEKFAEKELLTQSKSKLNANLMTAPHHGSKTSSQKEFIRAVKPQYTIFATGYRNRYRFPHLPIIRNYSENQVLMLNTVDSGAIQFRLDQENNRIKPELYRTINMHYWNDI